MFSILVERFGPDHTDPAQQTSFGFIRANRLGGRRPIRTGAAALERGLYPLRRHRPGGEVGPSRDLKQRRRRPIAHSETWAAMNVPIWSLIQGGDLILSAGSLARHVVTEVAYLLGLLRR